MTLQEYQAGCMERAGQLLAFNLSGTLPEKRDWRPHIEGAVGIRSALDMVSECILINRTIAHLIKTGMLPENPASPSSPRPFDDPEEAGPLLIESAKVLADAVRGMSEEDLEREYVTRRGVFIGVLLIEMPYRNMQYHNGQINMIQLLYGDTEFRMSPPRSK